MWTHATITGIALCALLSIAIAAEYVENSEKSKNVENAEKSEKATLEKRKGKLFPIFQVVTFPNSACTGTASKNGTCYTQAECSAKGGVTAGTCASSYGVCCTFTGKCGQTIAQNCTYFESSGTDSGTCGLTICKCSDNICQLRLDFNQFVITGPSTSTVSVAKLAAGVPVQTLAVAGKAVTAQTQCLTDTFSVTNPGGQSPPTICGINTGQHMYVAASKACNQLNFQLGTAGVGASLVTRQWSIKVTQYDCNYQNLAPPGCTQYYYGTSTATVQTYNYAGGKQLANQDQNICVRQERGNCKICWSATAVIDFQVSASSVTIKKQSMCCGYGSTGLKSLGGDCITIPGAHTVTTALQTTTKTTRRGAERICGSGKGLAGVNNGFAISMTSKTICSTNNPFNLRFLSDSYEYVASELAKTQKGFQLAYIQSASGCTSTTTG